MPRPIAALLVLALAGMLGCVYPPVAWSPDSRWLAFTVAVRPADGVLAPGWIYGALSAREGPRAASDAAPRASTVGYQLWATRSDTGKSVLLEESRGPLTAPCWRRDGGALVYGRVVPEPGGRSQFEIVVQDAPDRKRVVLKQPVEEVRPRCSELPAFSLAWSPDGRYLAVPLFQQTLRLAIIRADNGRVLKVVDDALLPAWSPDGSKLAFVRGTEAQSLNYLDTNFGPLHHLADIGQASQAPVWSHDRQSVLVVASRRAMHGGDPLARDTILYRVPLDGGRIEDRRVDTNQVDEKSDFGVSFGFDPKGENLFFSADIEAEQSEITWYRPGNGETHKKFNPIDFAVRIGSLAVSPNGKTLAFRAGIPGEFPPPGLMELADERLGVAPIAADDASRVEWVATLVRGALQLLRAMPIPADAATGRPIERATVVPIPGELPWDRDNAIRLRRIGRIGRPLCDRPADAPPASPEVAAVLDEARLFFDYLKRDYRSALAALESFEARAASPDHRLRLLSLRAQILVGLADRERSQSTIDYLQKLERTAPRRIELTPTGPVLTEERSARQGWPKFLANRAHDYFTTRADGADGRSREREGDAAADAPPPRTEPFGQRVPDVMPADPGSPSRVIPLPDAPRPLAPRR